MNDVLHQRSVFTSDLESMLLISVVKIVLQHNPPKATAIVWGRGSDAPLARRAVLGRAAFLDHLDLPRKLGFSPAHTIGPTQYVAMRQKEISQHLGHSHDDVCLNFGGDLAAAMSVGYRGFGVVGCSFQFSRVSGLDFAVVPERGRNAMAELSPLCPTLQRYCRHRANAVQAISTHANGLTHVSEQSDYSIT